MGFSSTGRSASFFIMGNYIYIYISRYIDIRRRRRRRRRSKRSANIYIYIYTSGEISLSSLFLSLFTYVDFVSDFNGPVEMTAVQAAVIQRQTPHGGGGLYLSQVLPVVGYGSLLPGLAELLVLIARGIDLLI